MDKIRYVETVIHVTGTGKVDVVGPVEIDDDRYRTIQLGHNIET